MALLQSVAVKLCNIICGNLIECKKEIKKTAVQKNVIFSLFSYLVIIKVLNININTFDYNDRIQFLHVWSVEIFLRGSSKLNSNCTKNDKNRLSDEIVF